jgi:hypothetical protein
MCVTQIVTIETPVCPNCGKVSFLKLPAQKLMDWASGKLIQEVFPDMHPDVLELLITGTHPECWDAIFGDFE